MIAADTSAVLHFLHGRDSPARFAVRAALIDKALALPPPVVAELLSGPVPEPRLDEVLEIASRLPLLDGFWERAGGTRRAVLALGLQARLADSLVAQACLDIDVPLIAADGDFRHFAAHCGLRLAV
ncbi:PIN domain-containing protein [Brevundimonas subvibrioides]|uniref:PIN domain-containing protein n=1 Tax=Brevundimonas subvibrioides TaxID=74313 RepID=UPI0022B4846B|nr:PIN domain-containing protein [Brevundimonas subvibrioides]